MRHVLAPLAVFVVILGTHAVAAAPSVLRPGANHHLGDDSFVAEFGRAPTNRDSEHLRMAVHLRYVRDLLAARPATKPALEHRRAELLGYLDDYIAKGITPRNTYVARRNPVFIDRDGNICAVGYLIERSVGRDFAEQIATGHRLDYLEDIAAAMPGVRSWIASSGFTLDELASIQPGYMGPDVQHQSGWQASKTDEESYVDADGLGVAFPDDGPYHDETTGMTGTIANHQMVGTWTKTIAGKVVGSGTFVRGAGTWKSFRADGSKLAVGPFVRSHAQGTWKFFHPSGRLAAVGKMRRGKRHGRWTLYYDAKRRTRLAVGRFADGETVGTWKHFGPDGKLVATATGGAYGRLALDIEPGPSGIRHRVGEGEPADDARLDGFSWKGARLYVDRAGEMFDGKSRALERDDAGRWTARTCRWSAKRKAAARRGNVAALFADLMEHRGDDGDRCTGKARPVPVRLAKRYEHMLASRTEIHAPIPAFDLDPARTKAREAAEAAAAAPVATDSIDGDAERPPAGRGSPDDMATYLADNMLWYMEWPYVDDSFRTVFASLPGY